MEKIDKNGKRIPTRNETESSVPPYFGYYLYSVLYTADPSGIAPFGKAL